MLMIAYLRGHFKCKGQEKSSMIYDQLAAIVGKEHILADEPMAAHTTFRVGGPADYLVSPESPEQVAAVVGLCREQKVPFMVIGNGSNPPAVIEPVKYAEGKYIKNLTVNDTENAADWSVQTEPKQSGSTVFGDRAFKFTAMPETLTGA